MADTDVITSLAAMPETAVIYAPAVCAVLRRSPDSIARAVARGELPAPFRLLGRRAWTAGAIVQHLQRRQEEAMRRREHLDRQIARLQP